ncbi:nuclear transport factor 2 family protein [Brucella pituitosa]|uniref:nuclear transport factor 2 family protein n=1 Tax=Brucella pituitosa TaxID=571256 RepID=UPI003CCC0C92
MPWKSPRKTRNELRASYPELAAKIEPSRYEIGRIIADDEVAAIVRELASAIRATGKVAESSSAIEVTIRDGKIVRYRIH